MKDFNELTWYIIPYNRFDLRVVGADPEDLQKQMEDGGEFYIHVARLHVLLFDLNSGYKSTGYQVRTYGPAIYKEKIYESYLEPELFVGYKWDEMKYMAIDMLWSWFKAKGLYNVKKHYKVKT